MCEPLKYREQRVCGQSLCVAYHVLGSTGASMPRAKTMVPEAAEVTA